MSIDQTLTRLEQTNEFHNFVANIKSKINGAQLQALRAVNKELISLYWNIGAEIAVKQQELGWGSQVVELLAKELQVEFPGMEGFSRANIWRMRSFYMTYRDNEKLAPLVREIGWSHNIVVLEKCKDDLEREYYIRMTSKFGWSRNVLVHNIETKSYERFLTAQDTFDKELPEKY